MKTQKTVILKKFQMKGKKEVILSSNYINKNIKTECHKKLHLIIVLNRELIAPCKMTQEFTSGT